LDHSDTAQRFYELISSGDIDTMAMMQQLGAVPEGPPT